MKVVLFSLAAVAASRPVSSTTTLKTSWDAYVSPLVVPEVLDFTAGGSYEMEIGRAEHNWTNPDSDSPLTGEIYGYSLLGSTPTFPGPTIKVAKGVPITVTWYNELSSPHLLEESFEPTIAIAESHCYPYCGVPVVTHIHGLESPAKYDGIPFRTIYKNQSQEFVYLNNQSASTKLYHDHANGMARLNVWSGLVGMYIIEDSALDADFKVDVETDIPLIIGDRLISTTGSLMYSDDNCQGSDVTLWVPESFGIVNLVNGVVMPYLEIPPAQVRFRLTNSANSRNYNFSIPFADKCKIIAKDGGYVQTPEQLSPYLNVFPFERVELFCDFSDDSDGTKYKLVDIPTRYQSNYDPRVMEFIVRASLKTNTMTTRTLPSSLVKLKDLKSLYESLGGKNRSITLGEMEYTLNCPSKSMIRYRGMEINMTTIKNTLACTKGKVEKWFFKNPTDDPHPFHWHLVNAQCGATDDDIDTNSLKDVVVIPNNPGVLDNTQICYVACTPDEFLVEDSTRGATEYNFDTSEPYVAHCHIMEHEENNMMALFRLTDVDDNAPNDDGSSTTTSNKLTAEVIGGAMGMSVLGGFATTLSVLVISIERLKFLADSRSLAVAFALSSGVMLFIGLTDLWGESLTFYRATFTTGGTVDPEAYEHGGSTSAAVCDSTCNGNAYLAVIGAFFGGVVIILMVECLVHGVLDRKKKPKKDSSTQGFEAVSQKEVDLELNDLNGPGSPTSPTPGSLSPSDPNASLKRLNIPGSPQTINGAATTSEDAANVKRDYHRAGMMTGVAVAIHNFPEGLALFVSSLQGVRTGIVLGIGIILHNMPEGVAIAAPVYYATGSKLEAFKWTAISGIAQPLGAGIGWAAVSGGMSYWLEATLYGLVAGMLVTITVKELLKGAYKFDPKGKLFVPAFFVGLAIIAFSLMALKYAGSS